MQGGHCGLSLEYNFEDVRWVSPYTYQQLSCALSPDSTTASNCWQGNTVPIGSTAGVEALSAGAPGKVESVLVLGVINAEGAGSIDDVYRMEQGTPGPNLPGPYCLDLQKGGQAVSTSCFEPVSLGITEGPDLPASFARVLAWVEGSDHIVLRHGADVIEYIEVSANAPAVSVTSPSTGGAKSGTQTVQWQAADADGDNMVFALMYSPDGGQRFVPVAANLTGTDSQADLDGLPGGDDAFFRVIASDNTGNSASADSIHFQVPNKPPHATILEPLEGSNYQLGAPVTLMGSASDKEDRTLPSSAYAWSSSIDGQIGVGPTLLVADLSPGTHTITLTAIDSKGLADSKSVELFVGVPALVDIKPDTVVPAKAGASTAITAYLELPFGYQAADIDVGSLSIKVGAATLSPLSANLGDFDNNSLADLTLTFDGEAFRSALPGPPGPATVTLDGQLNDGTPFRGGDSVSTVVPGDADCSGVVDSVDALAALRSTANLPVTADCLAAADLNCDLVVNSVDALNILRAVASLPVNAPPDCLAIVIGAPASGVAGSSYSSGIRSRPLNWLWPRALHALSHQFGCRDRPSAEGEPVT